MYSRKFRQGISTEVVGGAARVTQRAQRDGDRRVNNEHEDGSGAGDRGGSSGGGTGLGPDYFQAARRE